jgi:hypothetical protein
MGVSGGTRVRIGKLVVSGDANGSAVRRAIEQQLRASATAARPVPSARVTARDGSAEAIGAAVAAAVTGKGGSR